ncbi:hypothetical protein AU255_02135 [Methyloprofundus sedimenti]|uniref:Chemotaxis methyl-accepting receptor HlyB-like 4HB MCP domain-containing protein n=1 Tax=Methyloprofundus sedimenti TaxID=1420851 RepID=A0A1V8M5A5_9GAMM|nr:hypothetical protein [Methyloprofundus sedimenti]OQK16729.1 hypothetical protein AU255_02135 [Methyloprofundus sedimenti]
MNRVKKALPLLFILTMLISATSFYSLAQVDYKNYQKNTDLIWNINEQASLLCKAIIQVSRGEHIDYDHVTLVQQNLTRLTQQLSLDTPESIALNRSVLSFSNEAEKFKSLHAIYRNSLLFSPKLARNYSCY